MEEEKSVHDSLQTEGNVSDATVVNGNNPTGMGQESTEVKKKNGKKTTIIAIIAVVVLAIAIIGTVVGNLFADEDIVGEWEIEQLYFGEINEMVATSYGSYFDASDDGDYIMNCTVLGENLRDSGTWEFYEEDDGSLYYILNSNSGNMFVAGVHPDGLDGESDEALTIIIEDFLLYCERE